VPRTNVVGTTAPPGSGAQRCAQAGEREHRIDSTAGTASRAIRDFQRFGLYPAPAEQGVPRWKRNVAQRGDALDLLTSLPDACAALAFFDPQHRAVLDKLKFGNEGARQRERCALPAMGEDYIDACCREIARVLVPSGYCMRWIDTYGLCEAHHLRVADCLKTVDLIAWDNLRLGMGKRSRRRGDYLLVLPRPPVTARNWRDHGISSRWVEKVNRKIHPHAKPVGLIERLIAAVTLPGDLVIDPAAGGFGVLHAALRLGREFIGCDAVAPAIERFGEFAITNFPNSATAPPVPTTGQTLNVVFAAAGEQP
jgi:site-specific DNA-methyltransferase (adenine-specific)